MQEANPQLCKLPDFQAVNGAMVFTPAPNSQCSFTSWDTSGFIRVLCLKGDCCNL